MRRASRYVVIGAVLAAAGVAGTYLAYADWAVPANTATITLRVAAMPRGVTPSVSKQSKTAVVSWSAQEIAPDVKMTRYVVTARSQDGSVKPDLVQEINASGSSSESVTFSAAEVAGASWKWTVTPRFGNWAGAESAQSKTLNFPAATADILVEAPTPQIRVDTTPTAVAPTETAEPVVTPTATPPTEVATVPASPKSDAAPPPASSSAAAEEVPPSEPGPSASGSVPADIPQ